MADGRGVAKGETVVIEPVLRRVAAGENLSLEEMSDVVDLFMQGRCRDEEIANLLTGLRAKGETVAEIAGAAKAMRRHMTPIRTERSDLLDTCGTGGDGAGTFNVSTVAAFVVAGAGVSVVKHGNKAASSRAGSFDVLEALNDLPDPPSRTAVRTMMRILEEKGHLKHNKKGREFIYRPVRPRARAARSALRRVLQTFFDGSLEQAVAVHLFDTKSKLSDDELKRLADLIREAEKKKEG